MSTDPLATLIAKHADEPMWSAVVIAKRILASGWLAALIAEALEQAAFEAEEECRHASERCFCGSADWLRDRAARIARDGGSDPLCTDPLCSDAPHKHYGDRVEYVRDGGR